MSRAICAAKTCYNSYTNAPMMKFFPFPDDETRCKEWIIKADRGDLLNVPLSSLSKKYYLCSAHFDDKWFIHPKFKSKFKPSVKPVPTIFVNNLSEFVPKAIQTKIQHKLMTKTIESENKNAQTQDTNDLKQLPLHSAQVSSDENNTTSSLTTIIFCILCAEYISDKTFKDVRSDENSPLKEMIERILNQQVVSIEMPLHVCSLCELKVIECFNNILTFEGNYKYFQEMLMEQEPEIWEENDKHYKLLQNVECVLKSNGNNVNLREGGNLNECDTESINKSVLDVQMNRRYNGYMITCSYCSAQFNSQQSLLLHVKQIHSQRHVSGVGQCDEFSDKPLETVEGVNNISSVVSDKVAMGEFELQHQCEYCGAQFTTEKQLDSHLHTHDIDLFCLFCGKEFSTVSQKRFHEKTHTELKTDDAQIPAILCEICGRLVSDQRKLEKHMKKCHNYRFVCKICSKSFTTKDGLKRHVVKHASIVPCERCSIELNADKSELKRHLSKGDWKCFCGDTMGGVRSLYLHVKYSHQGELDESATVKSCPLCKETVIVKRKSRIARQNVDNGPSHCEYCNKRLSSQVGYKKHLKTHSADRPFACTFCSKKFRTRSYLRQHELIHKSVYSFKCDECDRIFKRQQSLIIHKRTHSDERPFHCETCSKRFLQKSDLLRHLRVHSRRKATLIDDVLINSTSDQIDVTESPSLPQLISELEEVGFDPLPDDTLDLFATEKTFEPEDNFLEMLQSMPVVWKFNS